MTHSTERRFHDEVNTRSIWRALGLVMAAGLLVTACATPQAATPAAQEGAKEAAQAPAGEEVTIRWRTRPSDASEQKVYEELNKLANDTLNSKGIKVAYDPGVNQGYFEKLKTELASGNAPDIFWVGGVETADFAATGLLMDLKPLIDKDASFVLADFYKQTVDELTNDGKIWGLPRDISTMVTYYNADLFKAAGLPTPKELAEQGKWNWETLLDSAKKLTDPAKQQYGVGFGNWWGPVWGYFTLCRRREHLQRRRAAAVSIPPRRSKAPSS